MVLFQLQKKFCKANNDRKLLDDELRDLQDKRDSIAHWEAQIAEIIQWLVVPYIIPMQPHVRITYSPATYLSNRTPILTMYCHDMFGVS